MAQRLGHLDGLRGAAAFSVFVCHFIQVFLPHVYYTDRAESHGGWEDEFATSPFNIVVNGNFAVCLFFVLSGYVLSCRFLENGGMEGLRRLAAKRYLRLAIPVLGAVLLAWAIQALDGYSYGTAQPITRSGMKDTYATLVPFWQAVSDGAFGTFFRGTWSLDPVLWTMQTELYGSFLVFGLLALFGRGRWRWLIYGAALLIFYDSYYLAFILGVVLADLQNRSGGGEARFVVVLVMITAGLYLGSFPYYGADQGIWSVLPAIGDARKAVFYHIIGASALILTACRFAEARSILSSRGFRFLGRISYSLYLIHFPLVCAVSAGVMLMALPALGYGGAVGVAFAVSVPVVVIAATVFTRLIDEPAIRIADAFATLVLPAPPGGR